MAYEVMNRMACWMIAVFLCIHCGYTDAIPRPTLQPQSHMYLPPLPPSTGPIDTVSQAASITETKYRVSYPHPYTTTTYKTSHIPQTVFQTNPQLPVQKSVTTYSRTYHDSYAPVPSGVGKPLPQPPTPAPLPSLIPKSVLEQFTSTASSTFPSHHRNTLTFTPSVAPNTEYNDTENTFILKPPHAQPLVMFETPASFLTPAQNETIFAAKLLATSLLQATENSPIEKLEGFNHIDSSHLNENSLNTTDVVIVKAQKNAYIIPTHLPTGEKTPTDTQELYKMRDKLEKAYTINQFIFIIRPDHINFLNKLV